MAAPVAAYVPAVRTRTYVYTSGQLPTVDGKLPAVGKVEDEVSAQDAAGMARTCALNALAAAASAAGGLEAIRRIVKVTGFVASAPGFGGQAQVINGASELLIEVFGEDGKHSRSAIGVAEPPLNAPVEVELIAEVRDLAGTSETSTSEPAAMNEPQMAASGAAVPHKLAERARQISDGRLSPAVPRDAATVILLRQAGSGVEAFLLRRTAELEFAPGAYVFPAGRWTPGTPTRASGGRDHPRPILAPCSRAAGPCAGAGLRGGPETFEESGVLLAGPSNSPADLVSDSAALAGDRHALLTGSASLGEVLARRGLVLRADLLTPWARWITPEASPRRFDTWFFAAVSPPGQTATAAPEGHADPGESESGTWLGPAAALEAAQAGEITLLPPTAVTLGELAGDHDVAGILARRRVITPRLPKVVVEDGQVRLAMPQAKSGRGDGVSWTELE